MATLTIEFPDALKARAEAHAIEAGFSNLGDFISQMLIYEVVGAPPELTIHSDADLEKLLASRIDGPWVEMDAADFQQMREKLKESLDQRKERP
jgi:hypothetical protein